MQHFKQFLMAPHLWTVVLSALAKKGKAVSVTLAVKCRQPQCLPSPLGDEEDEDAETATNSCC